MSFVLEDLFTGITWGEPQEKGNLSVLPLFLREKFEGHLLLLDEALEEQVLEMGEVSESGVVNTILIKNNGDAPVLILDGEELVGAKQNRMVNATVLIPQKAAVKVPVSCVERGRWRYETRGFSGSKVFGYTTLRRQKASQVAESLDLDEGFSADQSAIWQEVSRKQASMGAFSETDALHEVYDRYWDEMKHFIGGLSPAGDQTGVAVFINGKFSCFDLLASPSLLQKIWAKLLQSYAMEALEAKGRKESEGSVDFGQTLDRLRACEVRTYPSVGKGTDIRFRGRDIIGAGLADDGRGLHLCAFSAVPEQGAGMARPGTRRLF